MIHRRSWAGVAQIASVLLPFLLCVGPAHAKGGVEEWIAKAKAAVEDPPRAGALFGQAVAAAQKARDLEGEQAAAHALELWVDEVDPDVPPASSDAASAGRAKARTILAAVLPALDPKRSGAFVSAHAIAAELLSDAVAAGDGGHVEGAAAVLAAHASAPKSGKAAAILAKWGEGMLAVKKADLERADSALEAAAKACAAQGWLLPATGAATELAALRWKAREAGMAAAALAIPARLIESTSDKVVVQEWIRAVRARLEGIPDAALAEFRKTTGPFDGVASEGTAGGAGGSPGNDLTEVGRYLKRGADKPFATVTRATIDFEIRLPFDTSGKPNRPFTWGQDHWDQGGVTLAFAGFAVALRRLDLEGSPAQPSQRHRPSRVRAFYLLAAGETWGVSKSGAVTVSP